MKLIEHQALRLEKEAKSGIFYGYIIVATTFLILVVTFGLSYTFGIFLKPLINEFGWTRAVTSAAYSISTLMSGFLGIFAGKLSDKFGARVMGIMGGLFLGSGFLLMSRVHSLWQLYLFYGIFVAAGVGICWPSVIPAVARWFTTRRGLMTGVVASGIGFGTIILPPLANWLISTYSWRSAYVILGITAMVSVILPALFLKNDPYQMGQRPYGLDEANQPNLIIEDEGLYLSEALHTSQLWLPFVTYFCFGFGLHSVMVHVVAHATELGIPAASAASVLAIIGGMSFAGRIMMGSASDKLGVKPSLIITLSLMFITLLSLQLAGQLWMLYMFAVFFGVGYGGTIALQPLLASRLFGLKSLGTIVGAFTFSYAMGGGAGPVLSGLIFDVTGEYSLAFLICAVINAIGLTLLISLKPMKRATDESTWLPRMKAYPP